MTWGRSSTSWQSWCAALVIASSAACGRRMHAALTDAHMQVQEQGELAIRIDENVDESLANVDSAQAQLLKYLNSISSNRWLILKVFAVLVVFIVVFIMFVA